MKLAPLFHNYEQLVDRAEMAFEEMRNEHGKSINCELHCSDCCKAIFGLFLIEAVYIREHFEHLKEDKRQYALSMGSKADEEYSRLQEHLKTFENDPKMQAYTLARERIRCPMLDENSECILYQRRPITCRIYGVPTKIQGKAHVCGESGFEKGKSYPVFDLDAVYKDLYLLSKDLLDQAGVEDEDKPSLMISMSKAIRTSTDDLIKEAFK